MTFSIEIYAWNMVYYDYCNKNSNYNFISYFKLSRKEFLLYETARKRVDLIIEQMAKADETDENVKAINQLKWVELMNNYKSCAEEIVLNELIIFNNP